MTNLRGTGRSETSIHIFARAPGLWGRAGWNVTEVEGLLDVEVRLYPDFSIQVLVVDEDGIPCADIPVGYTATVDDGMDDLDLGVFRFNLVFGWHQLIEGIDRLGGG